MVTKVSKYYQSIISKLSGNDEPDHFQEYAQINNLTTGFGTIVLNIEKHGFYGIVSDDNKKFFPINSNKIGHFLHDRKRVQFCLQTHPEIINIYRWGTSVRIVAIQVIE